MNFGSINLSGYTEEQEKGHPPSIAPQTSYCGLRAVINSEDAKGMMTCWYCGLHHKKRALK